MKFAHVKSLFVLFLGLGLASLTAIAAPVPDDAAFLGPAEEKRGEAYLGPEEKRFGPLGVASLVTNVASSIAGGIVNQIEQDKLDRSAFTQEVVKQLHDQDPSKNYVIVHTKHEANWEGEKGKDWDHAHQEFDIKLGGTIGYEIYAAHKGNFKLKGDGGYLNWAFYGRAEKVNDKEYNFS